MSGAELENKVQKAEERGRGALLLRRKRLHEINGRRDRRSLPAEEVRQRPDFVARLDLLHVFDVIGIEKLRPV